MITTSSTGSSRLSTVDIKHIVDQLKLQQHRDSTKKNYYLVWKLFNQFHIRLDVKSTSWKDRLTLFVAYLIDNKKQLSTVKFYISAVKGVLKMNDIDIEEDRYLLSSLIRACRLKNDTVKASFPIQRQFLEELLCQIGEHFSTQPYLELLYKTLFSTTYYGLFRISEVTAGAHSHPVLAKDVQIATNKKKIRFILRSSKTHGKNSFPQIIKISATEQCRMS